MTPAERQALERFSQSIDDWSDRVMAEREAEADELFIGSVVLPQRATYRDQVEHAWRVAQLERAEFQMGDRRPGLWLAAVLVIVVLVAFGVGVGMRNSVTLDASPVCPPVEQGR